MFFDPRYIVFVMLPMLVISGVASLYLKSQYAKWGKVRNQMNMSGAEAAKMMLNRAGLNDVGVERVSGFLSDHYDPRTKVLRLSPENFDGRSVASVGVALHEAGHALQHAAHYAPLHLRTLAVPVANIGSGYLPFIMIIAGLSLNILGLAVAGLALFFAVFLFTVITLPVEFNASSRAKLAAVQLGVVSHEESRGVNQVLNAAAMTYVAAAIGAMLQLMYYAMMVFGGRRN